MSQEIILTAHLIAKPETFDKVKALLLKLKDKSRKEKGCVVYELTINKANPHEFVFLEKWASQEDFALHQASAHLNETRTALQRLLAQALEIRFYEVVE